MQSPHSNQLVLYFSKLQQPPWLSLSNWNLPRFHPHHYAEQQKVQQTKPKEQGDLAHRMSRFSQFVTSSACPDTLSLKSIKRILDGLYLEGANARLLPKRWWLLVTVSAKCRQTPARGQHFSFGTFFSSLRQLFWCKKINLIFIIMHLKDIKHSQQVFGTKRSTF